MKHTHSQRKSIIAWRQKLQALANAVDTGDANRDLRELHALDIAMIESGIYGLLAMMKNIGYQPDRRGHAARYFGQSRRPRPLAKRRS